MAKSKSLEEFNVISTLNLEVGIAPVVALEKLAKEGKLTKVKTEIPSVYKYIGLESVEYIEKDNKKYNEIKFVDQSNVSKSSKGDEIKDEQKN
jgi:hypothetical protein